VDNIQPKKRLPIIADGVSAIVRVVLFMLLCGIGVAAAAPLAKRYPEWQPELLVGSTTTLWALGLTILFVRQEGLGLADVGAAPDRWTLGRLSLGLLVGMALISSWAALLSIAGHVRWTRHVNGDFATAGWAILGFSALACREELAFRGYPLRRLQRTFGLWTAQVLVALAFAAEHRLSGMSWTMSLLGPGVGSFLFGMAAIASDGLTVPIGVHAAWNIGHWSLGLKGAGGLWTAVTPPGQEERSERVAMAAYIFVMALATLAFWLWNRRRHIA
jgi:membrane protease YdiL (CAAX protease family)